MRVLTQVGKSAVSVAGGSVILDCISFHFGRHKKMPVAPLTVFEILAHDLWSFKVSFFNPNIVSNPAGVLLFVPNWNITLDGLLRNSLHTFRVP